MSITNEKEYKKYLYIIQDTNFPQLIASDIPKEEEKLIIDLNTRQITTPEFLSVAKDHNSETLYFVVDRYYDSVDLATTCCVIQYENANPNKDENNGYLYPVPQYFLIAPDGQQKLIFPWVIEGPATEYSGTITFAVMFYRLMGEWNEDPSLSTLEYEYKLNTLATKSKILQGLDVLKDNPNYEYKDNVPLYNNIIQRLLNLETAYRDENVLYWIKLED